MTSSTVPAPPSDDPGFLVAALYRFVRFPRSAALHGPLEAVCAANGVCGTLLLADEGINGTIAGRDAGVRAVLDFLADQPEFAGLEARESRASAMPFARMKVRIKSEIVTMGVAGLDPQGSTGTYVEPEDWNRVISDPDTIVVDTRNAYETAIGSFEGAVSPQTRAFRSFPEWVRTNPDMAEKPKVAMFCTGGIRCEKASAFLKAEGFETVYHLKGGILNYLETVEESESLWNGACFVFDERVSVTHGLHEGEHRLCRACRRPLSEADIRSPLYEDGVSCAQCHGEHSEEDRARYRQRQRQMTLAKKRGAPHIGA